MAAAVTQTVFATASGTSTLTFTGVNADLGNAVVVIVNARDNGGATYISATWNGGAETADDVIDGTLGGGIQHNAIAFTGLTGTQTLVITMSAALDDAEAWANVMSGVDTTALFGTAVQDDPGPPATSPMSATVTSDSNGLVLSSIRLRADVVSTLAVQAGQTGIDGPQLSANGNTTMLSYEAGAASVSSGYTFDDTGFPTAQIFNVPISGTGGGGGGEVAGTPMQNLSSTFGPARAARLGGVLQ